MLHCPVPGSRSDKSPPLGKRKFSKASLLSSSRSPFDHLLTFSTLVYGSQIDITDPSYSRQRQGNVTIDLPPRAFEANQWIYKIAVPTGYNPTRFNEGASFWKERRWRETERRRGWKRRPRGGWRSRAGVLDTRTRWRSAAHCRHFPLCTLPLLFSFFVPSCGSEPFFRVTRRAGARTCRRGGTPPLLRASPFLSFASPLVRRPALLLPGPSSCSFPACLLWVFSLTAASAPLFFRPGRFDRPPRLIDAEFYARSLCLFSPSPPLFNPYDYFHHSVSYSAFTSTISNRGSIGRYRDDTIRKIAMFATIFGV